MHGRRQNRGNDLVKVLGGDGPDYVALEKFKNIGKLQNVKAELHCRTAIDEYKERTLNGTNSNN